MTETLCVGIALAHKNFPHARWNRVAGRLRHYGAVQVGGMFEFNDADPDHLAVCLHEWLEPDDRFVIRIVIPDTIYAGEFRVA